MGHKGGGSVSGEPSILMPKNPRRAFVINWSFLFAVLCTAGISFGLGAERRPSWGFNRLVLQGLGNILGAVLQGRRPATDRSTRTSRDPMARRRPFNPSLLLQA